MELPYDETVARTLDDVDHRWCLCAVPQRMRFDAELPESWSDLRTWMEAAGETGAAAKV